MDITYFVSMRAPKTRMDRGSVQHSPKFHPKDLHLIDLSTLSSKRSHVSGIIDTLLDHVIVGWSLSPAPGYGKSRLHKNVCDQSGRS